jgi:hypothetical protein
MPKKLHSKFRREAQSKGLVGQQADRYVYSKLRKVEQRLHRRKSG